jgi:hypothetical protein
MNKSLILLLQVIRSEGSIDPLLTAGLEYVQIAQLLTQAKQDGYVFPLEDKLVLTEEGKEILSNSSKQKIIGGGWIRSLEEYRVAQMDKDEIYLPESAPY